MTSEWDFPEPRSEESFPEPLSEEYVLRESFGDKLTAEPLDATEWHLLLSHGFEACSMEEASSGKNTLLF